MSDLLPPIPRQPMDPSDPASVVLWKRQFFDPIYRILGKASGLVWGSISKAGSSLKDIESRKHSDLQEIKGWTQGTGTDQNQHISPLDGKRWEEHRTLDSHTHHGFNHDDVYATKSALDGKANLNGDAAEAFATLTVTTANIGATTAVPWKLGALKMATVALATTGYVEVEINGVVVKLAIVT